LEVAKDLCKAEAKSQGGTSCEGTEMSPQAHADEPASGTRSGDGGGAGASSKKSFGQSANY